MSNKKEILILLVFSLLFSILALVNFRLYLRTIVPITFIFTLFLVGIILGNVFNRSIKSLLKQNYLYYFFTYLIAGNIIVFSFFSINNSFTDTKTKTRVYKIVSKKNIHKLITGDFIAIVNLKLTKHKNKTLFLTTGQESYINDLTDIKTEESEGNLGFKVIKDIFALITLNK